MCWVTKRKLQFWGGWEDVCLWPIFVIIEEIIQLLLIFKLTKPLGEFKQDTTVI